MALVQDITTLAKFQQTLQQLSEARPREPQVLSLTPRDLVLIKALPIRSTTMKPWWEGPYLIILSTPCCDQGQWSRFLDTSVSTKALDASTGGRRRCIAINWITRLLLMWASGKSETSLSKGSWRVNKGQMSNMLWYFWIIIVFIFLIVLILPFSECCQNPRLVPEGDLFCPCWDTEIP